MDASVVARHVDQVWVDDVLPALENYIRIPNLSPMFDPQWSANGHMDAAAAAFEDWAASRRIKDLSIHTERLGGRTPLLVVEVAGTGAPGDVLLYGHLDKQPPMQGWRDGLAAFAPVRAGDLLYGRGGADDGYAMFAALTAIEAVQVAGGQHARCVVLIEGSEESGSPDLPAYVDALSGTIGQPELVVCLDSSCATYDRLWLTTSLRGLVGVELTVRVLEEGAHSGAAGGAVPSSFRLLRQLLSRVEDEATGEVLVPELHVEVPPGREREIEAAAEELGDASGGEFPIVGDRLYGGDNVRQLRARTWEPTMAVVGADGLPPVASAGNVLRPYTTVKLSFRLPPTCDAERAASVLTRVLGDNPPVGAQVSVAVNDLGPGWNSPELAPWLARAVDEASNAAFGAAARSIGEGGSIPFMGMLGERFPDAQFVITGVLGPGSNAHGPNEFLHIPMAKGVTSAVAHILDSHASRRGQH